MKRCWSGVAVMVCLLSGCTDSGRGIVFDDQGGGPDTAERAQARTERLLDYDLRAAGNPAVTVQLQDAPVWVSRHRRAEAEWLFPRARVELRGPIADPAAAEALVRASLRPWLAEHVVPEITFVPLGSVADAALPIRAPEAPIAQPPIAQTGTSYVIQRGDTVGQLSVVFYGSAQHWRHIADANPGIFADGGLKIGATIIIPPAP